MRTEGQLKSDRLAVLIDADNAMPDLIELLLKEVTKYGTAHVKRIYGDWTNTQLNKWKLKLNQFAVQPIQQFGYTSGKNATDSALIIDAMDLLYTQRFDGFCIVSSDSDFTRLATRIREAGLMVYGFGEKKTPSAFINACDRFIFTEILNRSEAAAVTSSDHSPSRRKAKSSKDAPIDEASDSELKGNKELLDLLKDAYEAIVEEDEWVNLAPVGTQLRKLSPSFDPRNYGYAKLGELVQAADIFETKKNSTNKAIHIRLKS